MKNFLKDNFIEIFIISLLWIVGALGISQMMYNSKDIHHQEKVLCKRNCDVQCDSYYLDLKKEDVEK